MKRSEWLLLLVFGSLLASIVVVTAVSRHRINNVLVEEKSSVNERQ